MIHGEYWSHFLRERKVSEMTGWRWRKAGKIKVERFYGRLYVRQEEKERFLKEGIDNGKETNN